MEIASLLIGMVVGAGIVAFVMSRGKAALLARLEELTAQLEASKVDGVELQSRLEGETSAKIKAETLAAKLPEIEADMAALRREKESGSSRKLAALDAQMKAERKASEEKLKLINEAERKLEETFKSLAGETLNNTNKSFLQLAGENFTRFNEKAKQELSARGKSMEGMVKPIIDICINNAIMDIHGGYSLCDHPVPQI